jgi:phage terminase Nu1 subunit (DNA packaging protein)
VKARNRLLKEQAEHARLKNARLSGELVEAAVVQAKWVATMTRLRAALLAVPARVQQTSPHLSAADIAAIDAEIRAALTELAEGGEETTNFVVSA